MKVSVQILTYNHRPFVAHALDSALAQQTDFPFEVVVGDDCSTDGTQAVLLDYQCRHPNVSLMLQPQNLGSKENHRRVTAACRGEYIAFLDGDDFWTSSRKLQHLSDYLDAHPACPLACDLAEVRNEFGEAVAVGTQADLQTDGQTDVQPGTAAAPMCPEERSVDPTEWRLFDAAQLLLRSPASTSTCMVRVSALAHIEDVPRVLLGDKARAVALAHRLAPIACLPRTMTVRRAHGEGVLSHVWSMADQERRSRSHGLRIEFLEQMDAYTGHQHHDIVARPLARLYYASAAQSVLSWRWSDGWNALRCGWRHLRTRDRAQPLRAALTSVALVVELVAHQLRMRLPA